MNNIVSFWYGPLTLNNIFIPVLNYYFICKESDILGGWYEMPKGKPAEYTDQNLIPWIKKAYKTLKQLGISHNDIMLQNIIVLPGNDYRLIDFETVRFDGGGSFHDWCKCNQLIKRILLNNTSCNKDLDPNNVSFFRQ